ncbi:microsomal epoxide hydrolase [Synchytrium microbalum]|uniref:Microsomal epoxide hydrolase n=1 Tax=Synchytrium microbalum TaxID=1806994 RepID=A0A507BX15_9FUNG|nr:microsomal epoxide hydrolase [Synchytrium microbalum]TPX30344.1 microsomal epoxide hydrolase [Synchytrium microbalum]
MSVRTFEIPYDEAAVADLRQRLNATRLPDELENAAADYGLEKRFVQDTIKYWAESYDYKSWVDKLNKLPHFKVQIDEIDLHFVHIKSGKPNAIPIIISHGWPGSFFEHYKSGPILAEGNDKISFDVVIPSIPGFTFSSPFVKTGNGAERVAEIFNKLMVNVLGYKKYISQGGDWGSPITRTMAVKYPQNCVAWHTNFIASSPTFLRNIPSLLVMMVNPNLIFSKDEVAGLDFMKQWQSQGTGYYQMQATKPQTLAYGLADSPTGLLAWTGFGQPNPHITRDEFLTNLTMYWMTNCIGSSVRIYKESKPFFAYFKDYCTVPVGVAYFPDDLLRMPRMWLDANHNIASYTKIPIGGHFASWEQPELFTNDIIKFAVILKKRGLFKSGSLL